MSDTNSQQQDDTRTIREELESQITEFTSGLAEKYGGTELSLMFGTMFEEWTRDQWMIVRVPSLLEIATKLREKGVWVEKTRKKDELINALMDAVREELQWPTTIPRTMFNQDDQTIQKPLYRRPQTPPVVEPVQQDVQPRQHPPEEDQNIRFTEWDTPRTTRTMNSIGVTHEPIPRVRFEDIPGGVRTTTRAVTPTQEALRTEAGKWSKEYINLMKFFPDEQKYGGDVNESIRFKLEIFQTYCVKAGIGREALSHTLPFFLKGRALTQYFGQCQLLSYESAIEYLEGYFETETAKRERVRTWERISLRDVVRQNPTKTVRECFDLLYDKLMDLRPLIPIQFRGDKGTRTCEYVAQRARGAYVASVSQPEAAFDLSYAAQTKDPQDEDVRRLNKCLKWQSENEKRGISFVRLDLGKLRIVVFTNSSFANNKDMSSQIGYVIVLSDDTSANIIHWSSTKCRRVTRSVLAAELYALAHGFDIASVLKATIDGIVRPWRSKPVDIIACTDSRSLYDCLIKLNTTAEKRLMIDVMCLREAYERREIAEIVWIPGEKNPADAMTKDPTKGCPALRILIDSNTIDLSASAWVERSERTNDH